MRYLKLTLSYDGTDYVGWQVQPNGDSIQARMETAWNQVTGESIRITASGRTDAGVHAEGQVCSVPTHSQLDNATLLRAINANLPNDIAVVAVDDAPEGFHAIRDALRKTYRYQLQFGRIRDVLSRRYRWYIPRPLDVEAMGAAAARLRGQHDFASFQAAGSERQTTIRNLMRLDIDRRLTRGFEHVDLEFEADGFLYNMVRNLVGTLVEIGLGKQPPEWVDEVLASKDRRRAGPTAAAHGLFLVRVVYPFDRPASGDEPGDHPPDNQRPSD